MERAQLQLARGLDVQARIPMLSTYLGHREPAQTYWYLSAVPELLACAAERQQARWTAARIERHSHLNDRL